MPTAEILGAAHPERWARERGAVVASPPKAGGAAVDAAI
jgi:hypothetical protein